MKKLAASMFVVTAIIACSAHVGFGPGDPWSTVGGNAGLISNYPGAAAAPGLRALDSGVQSPFMAGAYDGLSAIFTPTAAGADLGDSGVTGDAVSGLIEFMFDGGTITTSTPLAYIQLPYAFPDAGWTVNCTHAKSQIGLSEGPVELGTPVYCTPVGDAGATTPVNTFALYEGANPLGTILGTVAHDGGAGLELIQYNISGW